MVSVRCPPAAQLSGGGGMVNAPGNNPWRNDNKLHAGSTPALLTCFEGTIIGRLFLQPAFLLANKHLTK
jgi:hypothetical protein